MAKHVDTTPVEVYILTKDCAHRRADRLWVVRVGAAAGQNNAPDAESVRRAYHGAYVSGVLNTVEQDIGAAEIRDSFCIRHFTRKKRILRVFQR